VQRARDAELAGRFLRGEMSSGQFVLLSTGFSDSSALDIIQGRASEILSRAVIRLIDKSLGVEESGINYLMRVDITQLNKLMRSSGRSVESLVELPLVAVFLRLESLVRTCEGAASLVLESPDDVSVDDLAAVLIDPLRDTT